MAAQVTALTTAIGVLRGTNNEAFAVALVFSLVVRARYHVTYPFVKLKELLCCAL